MLLAVVALTAAGAAAASVPTRLVISGAFHTASARAVTTGQESCGFRAAAIKALTKARIPWRAICQFGSLESVFATLEADMAIALFLSRTVPDRLAALRVRELPELPRFHINLRLPSTGTTSVVAEFARHIREGFSSRFA